MHPILSLTAPSSPVPREAPPGRSRRELVLIDQMPDHLGRGADLDHKPRLARRWPIEGDTVEHLARPFAAVEPGVALAWSAGPVQITDPVGLTRVGAEGQPL